MNNNPINKMYGLANLCMAMVFIFAVVSKIGYSLHLSWLNIAGLATALVAFVGLISIYIQQAYKNNHWLLHTCYVILLIEAATLFLSDTILVRSENILLERVLYVINALVALMLIFGQTLKNKPFMQDALAKIPIQCGGLIIYPLLSLWALK